MDSNQVVSTLAALYAREQHLSDGDDCSHMVMRVVYALADDCKEPDLIEAFHAQSRVFMQMLSSLDTPELVDQAERMFSERK